MRTLIRIVFVIFIANGIDCLGDNNCCNFPKYENNSKNGNITAESLVNENWFNAKENLVLKILKRKKNIFTSTENEDKISFKLDKDNNTKIKKQDEAQDPLKN